MNESRPIAPVRLPSVDQVLRTPAAAAAIARYGRTATTDAVRRAVAAVRACARDGGAAVLPDAVSIATGAVQLLDADNAPSLRRVFNLTGTVLHPNIAKAMGIDETFVRRLMRMAARRGDVEEIAHDHFFLRPVVERMAEIAVDVAAHAADGKFTAAEFRDRLDNGRKVAIQILEFFDRHGFTIRRQDLRRINPARIELFAPRVASTAVQADNGGVPLPVERPDFKSGWGRQTVSGGFDSHPPPPTISERRA